MRFVLCFALFLSSWGCSDDETPAPRDGVSLEGAEDSPASSAIVDMAPVGVFDDEIVDGVILSRLDVILTADATVGQVNATLAEIDGGIVSMLTGSSLVTVAIPPPADVEGALAVAEVASAQPGVFTALIGRAPQARDLPSDLVPTTHLGHLLPTRFIPAWNARLAAGDCEASRVPVFVVDTFGRNYGLRDAFDVEVPDVSFDRVVNGADAHGYRVTNALAAMLEGNFVTGANPFPDCLDLRAIVIDGLTFGQTYQAIANQIFIGENVIVNYSRGFGDACVDPGDANAACSARHLPELETAFQRVAEMGVWKELTHARWDSFLVTAAAGNEGGNTAAGIWRAMELATFTSSLTMASRIGNDFSSLKDDLLWSDALMELPSFAMTDQDEADVRADFSAKGFLDVAVADNVLVVGGVQVNPDGTVAPWTSTDEGGDVDAHADRVPVEPGVSLGVADGTSLSAPQVAGLASYLWALSPDLRAAPPNETFSLIVSTSQVVSEDVTALIDAYTAVLALDGGTDLRIRAAILDTDRDGDFDEEDIRTCRAAYFGPDEAATEPLTPTTQEHGICDLNGDGWVGGDETERFDLDPLVRWEAPTYQEDVVQMIGDIAEPFDETQLTDLEILCYYAYSDLYGVDASTEDRDTLLLSVCTTGSVEVTSRLSNVSYLVSAPSADIRDRQSINDLMGELTYSDMQTTAAFGSVATMSVSHSSNVAVGDDGELVVSFSGSCSISGTSGGIGRPSSAQAIAGHRVTFTVTGAASWNLSVSGGGEARFGAMFSFDQIGVGELVPRSDTTVTPTMEMGTLTAGDYSLSSSCDSRGNDNAGGSYAMSGNVSFTLTVTP